MTTNYPWQRAYLAAVLETDTARLAQRFATAQNAIGGRIAELAQDYQGTPEERAAIADALHGLGILHSERLSD